MLNVQVENLGEICVVHLQGHVVVGASIVALREAVQAQSNACAVILDLAGVNVIDARGLGALLELRAWAQSKGIEFRLMNVNRLVQQVLEITRLDTVFGMSSMAKVSRVVATPRNAAIDGVRFAPCAEV
jgi:anti-sigma B factor antagonist